MSSMSVRSTRPVVASGNATIRSIGELSISTSSPGRAGIDGPTCGPVDSPVSGGWLRRRRDAASRADYATRGTGPLGLGRYPELFRFEGDLSDNPRSGAGRHVRLALHRGVEQRHQPRIHPGRRRGLLRSPAVDQAGDSVLAVGGDIPLQTACGQRCASRSEFGRLRQHPGLQGVAQVVFAARLKPVLQGRRRCSGQHFHHMPV